MNLKQRKTIKAADGSYYYKAHRKNGEFKVKRNSAITKLGILEDLIEAGQTVFLTKDGICDGHCPLCGDYGECKFTGYPPKPEECSEIIKENSIQFLDDLGENLGHRGIRLKTKL